MQKMPSRSIFSWQSPISWVLLLVAALVAAVVAVKLLFVVAPGVDVDIRFSREQAINTAQQFQQQHFPELKTDRSAVVFVSDSGLQNYVELEGGGTKVFQSLIPQIDAVTHYWKVRNFAAGQQEELIMALSPQGDFISYAYLIPEKNPGAALDETAARALAEKGARELMGERFAEYKTLETRQKQQATGRVDFSFTYEHANLKANEARFRLELKVAGDKLVAVDTFKYIPESFGQRFSEMRALNAQISQIAFFVMAGIFGLGGLVGGGIWLFRRNELLWLKAFWPALIVGAGLASATLVNLPMAWMGYQTTSSAENFLFLFLVQVGGLLVAISLGFAIIYSVAEGLTRMAFADHPRLWDVFKPAALSPEILGRVLGAYAWTGFFLFYAMSFIWFSSEFLGWWRPSNIYSDPNILASWRPALGPIFMALQAGTWEECFFRAIPLALAVLIGKRFGIQKGLVIFVLILQAIVFAGAHANYAQMPGYSRLIELFFPAIVFGLVYLRFGLIVCVLTHFEYDLILLSLPIFTADNASLWLDRLLVIFAGSVPLLVLVWARLRRGAWSSLGDEWRNGKPVEKTPFEPAGVELGSKETAGSTNSDSTKAFTVKPWVMVLIALVSIVVMVGNSFKPERLVWPEYTVDRLQAAEKAEQYLLDRGVVLEGEWRRTTTVNNGQYQSRDFVWRHAGVAKTQELIGRYLDTPFWVVTWRKFDGPVEERSEYWQAWIYPDGSLHELIHQIPEGRKGAKLSREQAPAKAMAWIINQGWGDLNSLEQKSVEEFLKPERSDWVITYLDKAAFDQANGKAAVVIKLAGDQVVGYYRTIDIPQEWTRAEGERYSREQPFKIVAQVALLVLVALATLSFLRSAKARKFSFALALPWVLVTVLANTIVSLLWMESALANFQTSMSWMMQLGILLVGLLIGSVVIGLLVFLMAQAIHGQRPRPEARLAQDFLLGLVLAFGLVAYKSIVDFFFPTIWAPTPYSADLASYLPWLTVILNGFKGLLPHLFLIILCIGVMRFLSKKWRWWLVIALLIVWLICSSIASREFVTTLMNQLFILMIGFTVFLLIKRQQMGVALSLLGALTAIQQLGVSRAIYPDAVWHSLLSVVVCLMLAYLLVRHWYRRGFE